MWNLFKVSNNDHWTKNEIFTIKDFSSKCNQMFPVDLVTFTKEFLIENLISQHVLVFFIVDFAQVNTSWN